jgi:hypothetical protein
MAPPAPQYNQWVTYPQGTSALWGTNHTVALSMGTDSTVGTNNTEGTLIHGTQSTGVLTTLWAPSIALTAPWAPNKE